jgi:hypothetical protein
VRGCELNLDMAILLGPVCKVNIQSIIKLNQHYCICYEPETLPSCRLHEEKLLNYLV